jgi:hypothetical protein
MRTTATLVIVCGLALLACKKSSSSSGTGTSTTAVAAEDPSAGVRFTKKIHPVGTKYVEGFHNELSFDIDAKQAGKKIRSVTMKKIEQSKRRIEVMAINEVAVTKIKVTYVEDFKGESEGSAEPKKKPSVVSGKTYVVEGKGSFFEATTESGGTPTAAEKKILEKHFKSLGKSDRISAFLPDRSLQLGEKIPVTPELVRYMFESDDDEELSIDSAAFTFRSTRTDGARTLGTFDVGIKVTANSKKDELGMIMEFDGKLTLDKDTSWADELTMKGPLTIKGKSARAGLEIDGKGSATMTATQAPQ